MRETAPSVPKRTRLQRGFSLIELIVVITIIGILATAVVVNVAGRDDQAKVAKVKNDFQQIKSAASLYKLDNGVWPETLEELMTPTEMGMKYLDNAPIDPWTQQYYHYELRDTGVWMVSYGADQAEGGERFDADIYSDDSEQ